MRINPNGSQSNDVMYVHRLSGIGQGATFKFSAFLSNLQISETGSKPHLGIGIYEDKEGTALVSPNAFKDITLNKITDATSTVLPWQELSLEFQMDHSSGTAYFVVCAMQPETNGFDFAIDDISIDVLHPTVTIVNLDEYLFGQTVRLAADFENDGYFSNMNNVIYKWYYSADGSDYQEIYASSYTASKSFVLPIQSFDKDKDNGYYRVKIGESGSFESDICSIQGDFRVNETRNKKLVCLRHGEYNAEYNISADDPDIYDGMEIDINSSLTIIIRIIKPRTQTVTFDENGGTCAVETNAYAIGEQYGWLPEAAWQGHMFLGWWAADPDGAGEVPVATTNIVTEESARTLWARWAVLPSVSNVVARQRWPWNGLVDVDYEVGGSTTGLVARISFAEQGGEGRAWVATNFLAGAEPSAEPGFHRATWDTAADGATNVVAAKVTATVELVREPPVSDGNVWSLIGDFNSWGGDVDMTLTDGKWVSPVTKITAGGFKIRFNHDWTENVGGVMEALGIPFAAISGGDNISIEEGNDYVVTYDPDERTILVEVIGWGVVGTINSWGGSADLAMKEENGMFVRKNVTLAAHDEIKVRYRNSWDVNYGGRTDVGFAVEAISGGDNLEPGAGTYDIWLDAEKKALFVMKAGEAPKYWGVVGTINGWGGTPDAVMYHDAEGYFVAKGIALAADDEIKIRKNSDWTDNRGASYAAPDTALDAVSGGDNIKVAAGTYDVYYQSASEKIYVMTAGETPADAQ